MRVKDAVSGVAVLPLRTFIVSAFWQMEDAPLISHVLEKAVSVRERTTPSCVVPAESP